MKERRHNNGGRLAGVANLVALRCALKLRGFPRTLQLFLYTYYIHTSGAQ